MSRILIIGALTFFANIGISFAEEEKSDRYQKQMAKYEKTGEFENCVSVSRIRSTKVLDDNHIIFEMRGNKAYLNTLDRRCNSLGFRRQIAYNVRNNRICNVDFFNVIDNFGSIATCGFGKFEALEEKEAS